jgi:hypothetical protein
VDQSPSKETSKGKGDLGRRMVKCIYTSVIFEAGHRLRSEVTFTPWSLQPRKNIPRCAMDRRLSGLRNQPGRCGEEKRFLPLPEFELWPSRPKPIVAPTELNKKFPGYVIMNCGYRGNHELWLLWCAIFTSNYSISSKYIFSWRWSYDRNM